MQKFFRSFSTKWSFLFAIFFLLSGSSLFSAQRIAVVFGTNYKQNAAGIPPLEMCEKDAQLMERSLRTHGNFDDAHVLLGKQVTAKNVETILQNLAKKTSAEDTIILYFAGHGTFQKNPDSPNGIQNTILMFERPHLTDETLHTWIKGIRTKKLVWIFDSCFSGGIVQKGRRGTGTVPIDAGQSGKIVVNGSDQFYFKDKTLVSSSDSNETSIEITGQINHGLFSYWFARGIDPSNADLNRDQSVTVLEAYEWSAKRVTDTAKVFNHAQHPQIAGDPSGIILGGKLKPAPPEVVTPPKQDIPEISAPPKQEKPEISVPPKQEKPEVSKIIPPPTPTAPWEPVTADEPPVVAHETTSSATICSTIFESRRSGVTTLDPMERLKINRLPEEQRKVRVLVSGKEYPVNQRWLNEKELKVETGEEIPLGEYMHNGKVRKNRVLCADVRSIPTGVHEIEIEADDYPLIKRRLGVEKEADKNRLFVVASLEGYGSIQGHVYYKNFETPLSGQDIWMPTVQAPNMIYKMKSRKDGAFWFLNLPPGKNYFIKASFLEEIPLDNRYLDVQKGSVIKVDVILTKKFGR